MREISEMFASGPEFFGVEADVIGVTEHLLENEAGLLRIAGAGETFRIPEGSHAEGYFLARKSIGLGVAYAVAMDQRILDQLVFDRAQSGKPAGVRG